MRERGTGRQRAEIAAGWPGGGGGGLPVKCSGFKGPVSPVSPILNDMHPSQICSDKKVKMSLTDKQIFLQ